jgi:hypothetical protein
MSNLQNIKLINANNKATIQGSNLNAKEDINIKPKIPSLAIWDSTSASSAAKSQPFLTLPVFKSINNFLKH